MARKHIWPISVLGHWRWYVRYVLIPVWQARFRYRKVLKRLRAYPPERKIKVLFVTGNPAKWKSQSLYDLMAKDDRYEVLLCQTICDLENTQYTHAQRVEHLRKCQEFFESRGMRYVEAYSREDGAWKDLNDFKADLVFYNQPWDLPRNQLPHWVAKTALTFQIPYYVPNSESRAFDVGTPFQRTLFEYIALNEKWAEYYRESVNRIAFAGRIIGLGHTALDYYYLHEGELAGQKMVIYAPHWSFNHPQNLNYENLSTFLWTGRAMLDYARRHPEIQWVFKPHPTLRSRLEVPGVWTRDEVDEYYNAWKKIGTIHQSGGYEALFVASSAMITDCNSFRIEYACSSHPIVHLISPDAKIRPAPFTSELIDTYYMVKKIDELEPMLDRIVVRGDDYNRSQRLEKIRELGLLGNYAARNILAWLDREVFRRS